MIPPSQLVGTATKYGESFETRQSKTRV